MAIGNGFVCSYIQVRNTRKKKYMSRVEAQEKGEKSEEEGEEGEIEESGG